MPDTRFERQTIYTRRWVTHEAVPSVPLASELLAWYHHVVQGMDPALLVTVTRQAAELLEDIYKDDDDA